MNADTEIDADVIVVGGGLAGCFCALRLSQAGLTVLVLEAGRSETEQSAPPQLIRKVAGKLGLAPPIKPANFWPDDLAFHPDDTATARPIPPMMGTGLGGSSLVFSAATERMRRVDFERDDAETIAGSLPNSWSIGYNTLQPYYLEAERLMRVAGEPDPLDTDDNSALRTPPEISARDDALVKDLAANGMHPHRLHVGFDYEPGCRECAAERCLIGCKADGVSRALNPALESGRVRIIEGIAAHCVEPVGDLLRVMAHTGQNGSRAFVGRKVILAAGALNTPLVLQRSNTLWRETPEPALLGRGLMFHVSDIFAVRPRKRLKTEGPLKTIAFRDFYDRDGIGYGEVQSMGFELTTGHIHANLRARIAQMGFGGLGPALEVLRPFAWIGAKILKDSPLFATIMEDHPFKDNRVWEAAPPSPTAPAGRIAFRYAPSSELRARARQLRELVSQAFNPNRVFFLTALATPNWGHPMGTCRMGTNPAQSVTAGDGKVWGTDNIYVADASAFPSSGGANPSLTIVANALRVSDIVAGRFT